MRVEHGFHLLLASLGLASPALRRGCGNPWVARKRSPFARPVCGTGVSGLPDGACPRYFKPRGPPPKQGCQALVDAGSVSDPVEHVASKPGYSAAMKAVFSGESTEQHHAKQHPLRSAREAGHIVSTEELIPGWETLIHPLGERDAIRRSGRYAAFRRKSFESHKRPSTCGSGRLGLSCHV